MMQGADVTLGVTLHYVKHHPYSTPPGVAIKMLNLCQALAKIPGSALTQACTGK